MTKEECHTHIIEHIYDGIPLNEEAQAFIESDIEIKTYYHELKRIKDIEIADLPDPGEAYWNSYHERLNNRMESPFKKLISFINEPLIKYAAAALVLISIGYFMGKKESELINTDHYITRTEFVKFNYLVKQTRTLLTNFVSLDELNSRHFLEQNVEASKKLMVFASDLRTDLSGKKNIARLLGDLERILQAISALEEDDITNIKLIQNGINKKELITKLESIDI